MFNKLSCIVKKVKSHNDDSVVDRMHYVTTVRIMLFLAITFMLKQYVGAPIRCWVPVQFHPSWHKYAENVCFVNGTFFVSQNESISKVRGRVSSGGDGVLSYYQWVPFILLVQALFFYLPRMVYELGINTSGLEISTIIQRVRQSRLERDKGRSTLMEQDEVDKDRKLFSVYLTSVLEEHRKKTIVKRPSKRYRDAGPPIVRKSFMPPVISIAYLLMKFLLLGNCMNQVYLMHVFLGFGRSHLSKVSYHLWGWELVKDLIAHRSWEYSGHFPRITNCDFMIRQSDHIITTHSVQCVLAINMIAEAVYVALWFWISFLVVITAVDLLFWTYCIFSAYNRTYLLSSHLFAAGIFNRWQDGRRNKEHVVEFMERALGIDGTTVVQLIETNTDPVVTCQVVAHLWHTYHNIQA